MIICVEVEATHLLGMAVQSHCAWVSVPSVPQLSPSPSQCPIWCAFLSDLWYIVPWPWCPLNQKQSNSDWFVNILLHLYVHWSLPKDLQLQTQWHSWWWKEKVYHLAITVFEVPDSDGIVRRSTNLIINTKHVCLAGACNDGKRKKVKRFVKYNAFFIKTQRAHKFLMPNKLGSCFGDLAAAHWFQIPHANSPIIGTWDNLILIKLCRHSNWWYINTIFISARLPLRGSVNTNLEAVNLFVMAL